MKKELSFIIYSLASGGAERVVSLLLEELKYTYNITLVMMNDTVVYEIPDAIKVVYLENSNPKENGVYKFAKLPFLAWKYKKICQNNNIEISLSFMNRPNYINTIAKLLGCKSKIVISERTTPSLQHRDGIQGMINKVLIKYLYPFSDIVIANSMGNSSDLKNNFHIPNVLMIPNPLNLEQINNSAKEDVNFLENKFVFITIGRIDKGKNHKLLIEVMKYIEAKLFIIGDGDLKEELEERVVNDGLQKKIVFLGQQLQPYKYLIKADCFVFTSNHEGFPNVLLEALACELPIISTDCRSGPREILAPGTDFEFQLKNTLELSEYGILTPLNNENILRKAMNLIISDRKLRTKYSKKAKIRANNFSIKKIIKQYEEAICDL